MLQKRAGQAPPYGLKGAIDVVERERHRRESALAEQIHFISPSASISFMSYCVTTMPFVARSNGVSRVSGRAEITVPHG